MTLHCEVDSNPASKITWMFGEQELLQDTAANLSLSLDDVSPVQEGIYTCVGDNGYGIMNTSLFLAVKCESLSSRTKICDGHWVRPALRPNQGCCRLNNYVREEV